MHTFYRPHARSTHPGGGDLVTRQEFKDECDINNILKQYKLTGVIQHINQNQALYEDLPPQSDYQTSLNTILAADEAFASLPSVVRNHFNNDPALFLGAFNDPKAEDFLREHQLLRPKPVSSAPPAPAASAPPPNAEA